MPVRDDRAGTVPDTADLAGAARARWRLWRLGHGMAGAFRLVASTVVLMAAALEGEFPTGDPEKPRHGWVRLISPLSTDAEVRPGPSRRWLRLRLWSLACAGAWAGQLTYDVAAATLFWRPSHPWRHDGVAELVASTSGPVAVEHRTFCLGRRHVLRVVFADGREMWFTASRRDPATRALLAAGR